LTVIVLSIAVGTVIMATLVVPLNLAGLRGLIGTRPPEVAARQAEDPEARRQEVARAFRNPAPFQPVNMPAGVQTLFVQLGEAMRAGDRERLGQLFHARRMIQEFRRAGMLRDLPLRQEGQFLEGFKEGMTRAMVNSGKTLGWARTEIRSFKLLADGNEALVITRHRDNNFLAKMRWWLTQQEGTWQVYDFEDLDAGLRMSTLMAMLLPRGGGLPVVPPDWAAAAPVLQRAGEALRGGDFPGAERALAQIKDVRLPAPLDAVRWLASGSAKVGQRDFQAALRCLDKARALNPDMPCLDFLYGVVYNQTGRPGDALTHLEKYHQLLGDDADVSFQRGTALARLGRNADAVPPLRKALDEDPNHIDALLELRQVLPRGQKGELAVRYARLAQGHEHFEELALAALRARDPEAVTEYVGVLRKRGVNDPVVDACEARAKALAGQPAAAAALFQKATAAMPDGKVRQDYVREFLFDMIEAGGALAAYQVAPDWRQAFALMAGELLNDGDGDGLQALIAAHRQNQPRDPWIPFYTAELHVNAQKYDQADREFGAARAGLTDEQGRERARWRQVWVRCQAGKWQSAYEEIGPRPATFNQLAEQFVQDSDRARLTTLLALHRRHAPEDPKLPAWEAASAWLAGDDATTVRLLQKHRDVVSTDPRWRFQFAHRLLRGLVRLGRLEEACQEVQTLARQGAAARPGLQFAFEQMVRHRQTKAATVFAAAMWTAAPDDPEGLMWQARADLAAGRFALVGLLLRRALHRQPNVVQRDRYLREFLADAAVTGSWREGYRTAPDTDRAFRILADSLLNHAYSRYPDDGQDTGEDDFRASGLTPDRARRDLRQLIEAHLANRPSDAAAADMYLGALYLAEKAHTRAAETFARGLARKPSVELRQRFMYSWVDTFYRAGKGVAAYTEFGRDRQVFTQLVNLCSQDRNVKVLQGLLAVLRRTAPADADLPVWETEARYLAGDHAGALALLKRHRLGAFAQPIHRWKYNSLLVRCLARLKRFDEALKEAHTFEKERGGNVLLPAVVHAVAGDVARTRAALEATRRRDFDTYSLYADPDLGPALCSEPFRELQQCYPERLPLPLSARPGFGRRF
jgi:predicted Zn-dependent protease